MKLNIMHPKVDVPAKETLEWLAVYVDGGRL
jgi:hypothetical protein